LAVADYLPIAMRPRGESGFFMPKLSEVFCEKTGKRVFASKGEAARFGIRLGKVYQYRCTICNAWHLTSRAQEDIKRLRAPK
jgi:hypothetical protein